MLPYVSRWCSSAVWMRWGLAHRGCPIQFSNAVLSAPALEASRPSAAMAGLSTGAPPDSLLCILTGKPPSVALEGPHKTHPALFYGSVRCDNSGSAPLAGVQGGAGARAAPWRWRPCAAMRCSSRNASCLRSRSSSASASARPLLSAPSFSTRSLFLASLLKCRNEDQAPIVGRPEQYICLCGYFPLQNMTSLVARSESWLATLLGKHQSSMNMPALCIPVVATSAARVTEQLSFCVA